MKNQISPNGAIVDFLSIALTAVRKARDIARATGDEDALGLYLLSQRVAGAIALHTSKTVEEVTGKPSDHLTPFEAEILEMVRVHGTVKAPPAGTPAAYALASLLARGKLSQKMPGVAEYYEPLLLPIGENGAMIRVSLAMEGIYASIKAGHEYNPNGSRHPEQAIKSCQRLVDAGLAYWWEGKLMKKPVEPQQ